MRQFSVKSILWSLPILAVMLYVACMPWVELRGSDEAIFATVADEMAESLNFFRPTFQGQSINIFLLYPWMVCFLNLFHLPPEVAVRLPSVLAIFGMAAGAFLVARRHRDANAGAIAALIVLTAYGAMRIGIIAQAETIHAALLSGAWFAWHTLGPVKQKWNKAWSIALGMVFLNMLNVGLRAVILFYLPLIVTLEPPRTRRLLRAKEHLRWIVFFALVAYFWLSFVKQPLFGWTTSVGPLSASASPEGFVGHLFIFPGKCFIDLLPWGLLFWVPFCLDLRKLEPTGSICGFLRAAVLCIFIVYWLLPGHSSLFAMAALPPMAVMISFTLPIVLHRYEHFWKIVGWTATVVVACFPLYSIIHWGLCLAGKITFADTNPENLRWYVIGILLILMGGGAAVLYWGHRPAPLGWAWLAVALRLVLVANMAVIAFLTTEDRRFAANQILAGVENALEEEEVLYFITDADACPAQLFYTGHSIRRIKKAEHLPTKSGSTVYLVAEKQPVFPGWNWEKLSGPVDFHLHREVTDSLLKRVWRSFWKSDYKVLSDFKYHREEISPESVSESVRVNYEPLLFNLYKGNYVGTSANGL